MKPIPESELIITKGGEIYHLNLLPEEIADTIITVGDPDRVKEVSKHFDVIEVKKQHREFVTHTGTLNGKRISVVSTGIGPDNIDIVLTELDALVNIDFKTRLVKKKKTQLSIIRIGTSGALQKDIPVDSVVASSHAIGLDNLMQFYKLRMNGNEKKMQEKLRKKILKNDKKIFLSTIEADKKLLKLFSIKQNPKPETRNPKLFSGITVTCPGFYGPQGRIVRNALAFPKLIDKLHTFTHHENRITNFEMETAAIYSMSRLMGHRALSLSAIVANRISKEFSSKSEQTIQELIISVLKTLSSK